MAVDYFLKLDTVPGESEATGFTNQIQVLSWSWGGSNTSSVSGSGGSGAGKVSLSDLSIMINFDKSSPALFKGLTTGTHYKTATLSAVKTGTAISGGAPTPYLTVDLTEVFVSSLQLSASSEIPMASVSFTYKSVEITYKLQKSDGTTATGGTAKYDVTTNTSS